MKEILAKAKSMGVKLQGIIHHFINVIFNLRICILDRKHRRCRCPIRQCWLIALRGWTLSSISGPTTWPNLSEKHLEPVMIQEIHSEYVSDMTHAMRSESSA